MGRDWDKLLAYETLKVVMIEDKILGGLHWGLTFVIAIYVGLYIFLYEKGYLKYESVTGIVRLNVQSPGEFDIGNEAYCTNSGLFRQDYNPRPCEVWSKYMLSATEDLSKSFFLVTSVEYATMSRNCTDFFDPDVEYRTCSLNWTLNKVLKTYIADVQKFEITLTHNAFAPEHSKSEDSDSFYYKGSSVLMEGEFVKSDLSKVVLPNGVPDKFKLGELITNVNNIPVVALDQKCTDHTCETGNQSRTFREIGIVLVVNIEYTNDYGIISPNPMRYKISVSRMSDATYSLSTLERVIDGPLQARTVKTIRGVRLDFIQSGQIGKPNFTTILSVAFASVVLLKVAATMVDLVATKILKNRRAYTTMKYYRVDRGQVELRKKKIKSGSALTESFLGESSFGDSAMDLRG